MNPLEELVRNFQDLVAQVPEVVQPFIVMLAGAVPFIEGELAAMIGVVGGLNPIVAAIAAAGGNFLAVLAIVTLTSRARTAVVDRRAARVREANLVSAGVRGPVDELEHASALSAGPAPKPESKGRARFLRWLVRFGVPGASIIGPFAIPTHFMSAILVSAGTPRRWVLLWQAVSIVLWTTVGTVSVWAALTFLVGI